MFVAFMVMWACTPSSLRRDSGKGVTKAVGSLSKPDDIPLDTIVPDTIPAAQTTVSIDTLSQGLDSLLQTVDSLAEQTLNQELDSLLKDLDGATAKMKRDTTMMDSLELAI